jgi:hypothetical protein
MSNVEPSEAGLASGVVNTSFMMGGALGLAILASSPPRGRHASRIWGRSARRSHGRLPTSRSSSGALFAAGAGALSALLLRPSAAPAMHDEAEEEREQFAEAA